MLSRNQIRQAALQYLYATSQTPEAEQEQDEGIWDILMEPFRGDYCKLRAKAVSGHLTRDYPDKLRLFVTRARETADKLQHDPLTLPVRDLLQDLLVKEGEFNASLLQLKKTLYEDPSNDKGALSAACDAAQELNTTLMQMRRRRTPSPQRPGRPHRHLGSHPPGGTLLLRGIPPLRQRRAGRHLKNGTPGVTTTLYHGWIL